MMRLAGVRRRQLSGDRAVISLELLRFLLVGLANTAVGLAIIYLTKLLLGFSDIAANAMGYACGLTLSFFLNSSWTFDYRGRNAAAAGKFLLAFAISYGVNLFTVWLLIERALVNSYLAQALGIPPYTACFFLLSKLFVFRRGKPSGRDPLASSDPR